MSEQQVKAGKVDKAEEVLDVIFPSSDEAAEVVHPGKEPLHFPAFSIAAELAAILSSAFASAPVRSNQFDPILVLEHGPNGQILDPVPQGLAPSAVLSSHGRRRDVVTLGHAGL